MCTYQSHCIIIIAPAISDVGQAITSTLEQNEASYIQLDLPEDGMTFRLDVSQGSVVMYGSNKIQNPNEAFYDFKLSNNQPELFVTGKTFFSSITKRQVLTNNTDDITIYISIEGQECIQQLYSKHHYWRHNRTNY